MFDYGTTLYTLSLLSGRDLGSYYDKEDAYERADAYVTLTGEPVVITATNGEV